MTYVPNNKKIVETIFGVIDNINQKLPNEERLEKSVNTVLFGASSKLDSLGFVQLIVEVEQRIEKEFGEIVTLANDQAMTQKNSPFRTVGTLTQYILSLLEQVHKNPKEKNEPR